MKVAIINDIHIGARSDSPVFLKHQQRFFSEVFFPRLREEGIDTICILGDLFDRRKFINFKTLHAAREFLFEPMREYKVHLIAGNHDCALKNTNEINSPDLLLERYDNIVVYDHEPAEVTFGKTKVLLVPWITEDNHDLTMEAVHKTKAKVCMAHLELSGFQMYLGLPCDHGMSKEPFEKFSMVLTGHYHHKSDDGHVFYLGSPVEYTWHDYNDPRGFHIFDTETMKLEHVLNPNRVFRKITFDDRSLDVQGKQQLLFHFKKAVDQYRDCYVRIMVRGREDNVLFDQFCNILHDVNPADVTVVEDVTMELSAEKASVNLAEDTTTMLRKYVDQLTLDDGDKMRLTALLERVYEEAQEPENFED